MGSLQHDPSMLDMAALNGDLLNPNLNMAMDLDPFSSEMQMDMGDVSAVPYNSVEPMAGTLSESEHQNNDANDNISMSGIGAGPLPTGFGSQTAQGVNSTLTEFTKRRNWSQRLIEELKDLLYILTADGRFLYLSPSVKFLTGFESNELTGQFIHDYIHSDDASLFIREFNESIATGNPLRFFYRFRSKEGKYVIFECHGHPHLTSDVSHMEMSGGPQNAAGFCRGFFMMARPYPTKQAELLDSLLEHKIENERLQARIAALKREEAEEAEATRSYHKRPHGAGSLTPSNSADITPESPSMASRGDSAIDPGSMPPPARPTVSNTLLTQEALDYANASARPDSITDKMARYEGSSHVDSIEMFTGLRYREGERSHGISTGGTSPALIRGDAGIEIPVDKQDARYGSSYLDKKPKKVKSADEYVCTDCGTLDSPEWRKGPNGPKTLCNACGLRWAKKEKKRGGTGNGGGSGGGSGNGGGSVPGTQHSGNGGQSIGHSSVPGLKHNDSNES